MKFKVKEFRTKAEFYNSDTEERGEFSEIRQIKDVPEDEKNQMCRFCWMDNETDDNPKVTACKCIGSVKYIHFLCLK